MKECAPIEGSPAGSVFEDLSIENSDRYLYMAVAYAKPQMPIGQTWGTFGAIAIDGDNLTQADAQTNAQDTADFSANAPLDAIPPTI